MTRLDKLKSYMELCDIRTQREIHSLGEYPKSVQYMGQIFNGQKNLSDEEEKLLYLCINRARAKKLMGLDNEKSQDTTETNE